MTIANCVRTELNSAKVKKLGRCTKMVQYGSMTNVNETELSETDLWYMCACSWYTLDRPWPLGTCRCTIVP